MERVIQIYRPPNGWNDYNSIKTIGGCHEIFSLFSLKNITPRKIIELKNKANKYRNERNKDINSFNKKKIDATNKLLNTINPILVEYSDKNSISMIFQKKNIIIGKSDLDITDEILKIVDSKINKIKKN